MNDKEYEELRNRIREIARAWLQVLGLGFWKIDLEYSRDGKGVCDPHSDLGNEWDCAASVLVKWQYLNANIIFNLPIMLEMSDNEIEDTIIHEICHVLVNEMREYSQVEISEERLHIGRAHEERVVSSLTNAFKWVRSRARDEIREEIANATESEEPATEAPSPIGQTSSMD